MRKEIHCEDCGTKLELDGTCPNCHEELFIATWQGEDTEQPWSDEFRDAVEEQTVYAKRNLDAILDAKSSQISVDTDKYRE